MSAARPIPFGLTAAIVPFFRTGNAVAARLLTGEIVHVARAFDALEGRTSIDARLASGYERCKLFAIRSISSLA
jgi:hypothetical protein